jgi:DNA-binding Lrp family transcriptional regulator
MSVDRMDLSILRELREDGRLPLARLANRLHISRTGIYQRLERLQKAGALRGFTAAVDSRKLGLDVAAMILVSAGRNKQIDWPALRDRFSAMPQVSYVAFVTGEADILLFVRVASPEALRRFVFDEVRVLPGVSNTQTLVVLDEAPPRPYVLPDVDDRQPRASS